MNPYIKPIIIAVLGIGFMIGFILFGRKLSKENQGKKMKMNREQKNLKLIGGK